MPTGIAVVDVHLPSVVDEAVASLDEVDGAVPVAGGTDVLLDRRLGRTVPTALVDLAGLPELVGLRADGDGVWIGAMTRLEALVTDRRLRDRLPALVEGALGIGTPLLRGMATVGGNLCRAAPHGEIAPALLVHDAMLTVVGPAGVRELPSDRFLLDTERTALGRGELLIAATVPVREEFGAAYVPFDPAGVGVAVGVGVRDGRVHGARVAVCATVPVPRRVRTAEAVLDGVSQLDADVLADLRAAVGEACHPPHDVVHGPADHRRHVTGVMAARAAHIAWLRATSGWRQGALSPPGGRLQEVVGE